MLNLMRIRIQDLKLPYILFFVLSILLSSCGGGGNSGSAPAPAPLASAQTASKAAADAVISSFSLAQEGLQIRPIPIPGATNLKMSPVNGKTTPVSDISKIRQGLGAYQSALKTTGQEKVFNAPGDGTFFGTEGTFLFQDLTFETFSPVGAVSGIACGSITIDFGADLVIKSDDSFTLTMTGCGDPSDPTPANPAPSFAFGTIDGRAAADNSGFQLTYTNFNWREHRARRVEPGGTPNVTTTGGNTDSNTDGGNGQATETDVCSGGFFGGCSGTSNQNINIAYVETIRDGSIILPFSTNNCTSANQPTNNEGIFNLSGSDKLNVDGDKFGVMEVDQSFVHNLTILVTETAAPNCVVTITINGRREFTDNLDPAKSFVADYVNASVQLTRTSRSINTIPTVGDDVIQSGTVTITSPCTNGTFTLSTEAGNPFFVPDGSKCAVLGKHLVTDTISGIVTAIMATPSGGIDMDQGNDGTVEQSFLDCREAILCTN